MEQAVHHREEYGTLDRKLKSSSTKQPLKNVRDLQFTPQPLKNEFRSQPHRRNDGQLPLLLSGQQQRCLRELRAGSQQSVEPALLT